MTPNEQFQHLYADHERDVRIVCTRICRNAVDADDIINLTWIAAWGSIKNGNGPETGKEKSWLRTVAQNRARDFYRAVDARKEHEVTASEAFPNGDDEDENPLEQYSTENEPAGVSDQRLETLKAAMTGLTSALREVMVLRYISGLDTADIADKLNVSQVVVRKRLERGLSAMRQKAQCHK